MKALLWGEYFLPAIGGAEIFLSQLLPALTERGIECHLVTTRHSDKLPELERWKGVSIHRMNFQEAILGNIQAFAAVRRKLLDLYREIRPDLIHLNSTGPSLFFELQTHRDFDVPRFLTAHSFFSYPPKEDGYLLKLLPKLNYLSAVSRQTLDKALALFASPPPHCLIYNGVQAPPISSESADPQEIILYLGRLSPEKGIDLGIQAFHRLSKNRPDSQLWIVGEGGEEIELRKMVADLGMEKRVRFRGAVPPEEVYAVIAECRFLILPSRIDEGLPLSALQAALAGKPMVAVRRGGIPEFVRDGETGLLFESEDDQGLAAAMERLLSEPALGEELGRKARALAQAQFDFTAMVDQYERIYRQLARA